MDEMQRKAFEAGRHGESMPRDRGATTEEIHAYFDGVLEKQEREARELGTAKGSPASMRSRRPRTCSRTPTTGRSQSL